MSALFILIVILVAGLMGFISYLVINAGEPCDEKRKNELSEGWDDNKTHTEGEL
jgi:hypothetical protein